MAWGESAEPTDRTLISDSSGCVRVAVDDAGHLAELKVSARWREKLGPARLAQAVAEAMTKANADRLEKRAQTAQRAPNASDHEIARAATMWDGLPWEAKEAAWRRLTALSGLLGTEAAQSREGLGGRLTADYAGVDERRHVSVSLNAFGALSDLTMDEKWLSSVSTERLIETVLGAFRAAYEAFDGSDGPDQAVATPAADQVLRLLARPDRLRQWLDEEE